MIERRYPIQTVLANRKMFAGGGVVSPQQTAAPVQPSGGILSSSAPLMEAVAADAVNPAGGSTMVEAVEFNEGGAVRGYAHGGAHWDPDGPSTQYQTLPDGTVVEIPKPPEVVQPRAGAVEPIQDVTGSENLLSQLVSESMSRMDPRVGERTRIGPGSDPEALERRADPLIIREKGEMRNLAGELFPYEAKLEGGVLDSLTATSGPWLAPGSGQGMQGPSSLLEDAAKVPYNVADSILREAGQLAGSARDTFIDIWSSVSKDIPDDVDASRFAGQQFAIGEALRRRPTVSGVSDEEVLNQISDTSKKLLQNDPQVSGEMLQEVLARDLIETFETPYRQATQGFGGLSASGDAPDTSGEDITSAEIEAQDLDRRGEIGADENALIGESDADDFVTGKAAEQKLEEQDRFFKPDPDVARTNDDITRAEIDAEDESSAPGSRKTSIEALAASGFDDVVKKTETPAETKKGMSDYLKRFKKAMGSEYEGMSDSEKGFAIMEAGLKIMAGKSEHALVNIAEGLKGLGPQFAKDAKEKRMWNRQVDMAAAKYALQSMDRDIAQDKSDLRKGHFFYDQSKKDKDNPYGRLTHVSMAKILENNGALPPNMVQAEIVVKEIAAAGQAKKTLTKLLMDNAKIYRIDSVEAGRLEKDVKDAETALISGEVGLQLLSRVKAQVKAGKVTGLIPAMNDLLTRGAAAANIDLGKEFSSVAEARDAIRRAFQALIPLSLGKSQTANSISNKDVQFLADAYIDSGFLKNNVFGLAFVKKEVLESKIEGAMEKFRESQKFGLDKYNKVLNRLTSAEEGLAAAKAQGLGMSPGPFGREYFAGDIARLKPYAQRVGGRQKGEPQKQLRFASPPGWKWVEDKDLPAGGRFFRDTGSQ